MMIRGQVPYGWDQVNAKVQKALGTAFQVQTFKSTSHALFDICIGLHLKFSHKRKMVVELGQGSHLHNLQIEMAKMGVRFKTEFVLDSDEAFEKDIKATLAYISDRDDALTGAIYDRSASLNRIAGKSLFTVQIFHHHFSKNNDFLKNIGPYDICVVALGSGFSVAVMGEKCILPALSSNTMNWTDADGDTICECLSVQSRQDQEAVLGFESHLPEAMRPWYSTEDHHRFFDRSVVVLPEHDGAAFVELFCEQNNIPKSRPGQSCPVETTSFSYWNNKIWLDQAESHGRSENDLRGMVSFHLDIIDASLVSKVERVLESLASLST